MIRKNACILLVFFLCFTSCARVRVDHGAFRFGVNKSIKSAPIILASSLGLFEKEGLDINVEIENSAVGLMSGLFSKQYDLVGIPVYRAIVNFYTREDFRIIAVLNRNQSRSLVMNSLIVQNSSDLAGKRIGLVKESAADFTLYRLLLFKGLTESDVEIQYFEADDLAQALAKGDVDAIISWEPFTSEAVRSLGTNSRVENSHFGRDMYWLLVTRAELVESRSEDLSAVLRALDKANVELNTKTTKSLNEVAGILSVSPELLFKEWEDYSFHLELPQSLLLSMEQEAEWYRSRIDENLPEVDFLYIIARGPLSKEFQRRVSIVGIGEFDAP